MDLTHAMAKKTKKQNQHQLHIETNWRITMTQQNNRIQNLQGTG